MSQQPPNHVKEALFSQDRDEITELFGARTESSHNGAANSCIVFFKLSNDTYVSCTYLDGAPPLLAREQKQAWIGCCRGSVTTVVVGLG